MLRIISDVHGKHEQYLELIHNAEYSLQLGDFGFDYKVLDEVDPNCHKILKGNHDNHDDSRWPHFLRKFGYSFFGGCEFFHMQGAFSIDWRERVLYDSINNTKSWWANEQLSYAELEEAVELYRLIKPDLVFTHDAPRSVVKVMFDSKVIQKFGYNPETFTTHTSEALQAMLEIHRPKKWKFAHYHKTIKMVIEGTEFSCMHELGYEDLKKKD